jgi:hypothetical protein
MLAPQPTNQSSLCHAAQSVQKGPKARKRLVTLQLVTALAHEESNALALHLQQQLQQMLLMLQASSAPVLATLPYPVQVVERWM